MDPEQGTGQIFIYSRTVLFLTIHTISNFLALRWAIAELVVQKIENCLLKKNGLRIIFWRKYIDNIFVVADPDDLDSILDMTNSICFPINFNESGGQLPFLDILVHREVSLRFQKVNTSFYRKKKLSQVNIRIFRRIIHFYR